MTNEAKRGGGEGAKSRVAPTSCANDYCVINTLFHSNVKIKIKKYSNIVVDYPSVNFDFVLLKNGKFLQIK